MKDLRPVLLLVVPLLVVVAGIVLFDLLRGPPEAVPSRPEAPAARGPRPAGPGTAGEVERQPPSPIAARMPGPPAAVPGTRRSGITDPVLTVERARKLIESGTWEDWAEIETLLRVGDIPDPLGLEALFLSTLAKGGNGATFLDRVLPALSDPDARAKAVEDLLILARESTEPNALKAAFSLLGKMAKEDAVETIGQLARLTERQEYFTPAVYAIATIGGAKAVGELDRLFVEQVGSDREHIVIRAIAMAGSPEMVAALSAHLAEDAPAELRLASIRALGLTGRAEAIGHLRPLATEEATSEVAEQAVLAISHVGGRAAAEELLRLRKQGGPLGDLAGRALGNVTGADAAKALAEALPAEEDEQVKVQMIDALGNSNAPEARPPLRELLGAEETAPAVRGRAARALGRMGDVEVLDPILRCLAPGYDGERALQVQMVEAIEALTVHEAARPALFEKAIPILEALAERAPKHDALHYFTVRSLNRLQAARPRATK